MAKLVRRHTSNVEIISSNLVGSIYSFSILCAVFLHFFFPDNGRPPTVLIILYTCQSNTRQHGIPTLEKEGAQKWFSLLLPTPIPCLLSYLGVWCTVDEPIHGNLESRRSFNQFSVQINLRSKLHQPAFPSTTCFEKFFLVIPVAH